jgi:hypothetical protein
MPVTSMHAVVVFCVVGKSQFFRYLAGDCDHGLDRGLQLVGLAGIEYCFGPDNCLAL